MLKWFLGLSLHARIAIMVAPILGIGGYGMMDLWINKDKPDTPKQADYQELQQSGECLLATNQCKLHHEGMDVSMLRNESGKPGIARIEINPSVHLRGVQMSLVQQGVEHRLIVEQIPDTETWFAEFPEKLLNPSPSALRIALARFGRVSFAEVPAQF